MTVVLSLCDRTGNMVQPWLDAGYEAVTVDKQEAASAHPARHHFAADVRTWHYPLRFGRPAIVFAFPPCTDMAVSGARWLKDKGLRALIDALTIVDACREICEASGAPWMIEHPVSTLATYWRKPDYSLTRTTTPHSNSPTTTVKNMALDRRRIPHAAARHARHRRARWPHSRRAALGCAARYPQRVHRSGFARAVFRANARADEKEPAYLAGSRTTQSA